MRRTPLLLVTGLALVASAACSESIANRLTAPDNGADTRNPYSGPGAGRNKVTICHAAGREGTTKYVEITVGAPAQRAHIDDANGTPKAGHEEDFYTTKGSGCGTRPPGPITKKLIDVMIIQNGLMVSDPVWLSTGEVRIPAGETRWLDYQVVYTLPNGSTGTVTENEAAICSTMGSGVNMPGTGMIGCSINYGMAQPSGSWSNGVLTWNGLRGNGSLLVPIDIVNGGLACGRRDFTNTATLTFNGRTHLVTATTPIHFTGPSCP